MCLGGQGYIHCDKVYNSEVHRKELTAFPSWLQRGKMLWVFTAQWILEEAFLQRTIL